MKFAEMVQQQHKKLEVEVYERVEHAIAGADEQPTFHQFHSLIK